MPSAPDLAIVYEHPSWFEPLFAALDRRGLSWTAIDATDHAFDPGAAPPPAPVIFNRIAMSASQREPQHPIFYAQSLFAHWEAQGARVLNGAALAVDTSKARQLSLIRRLGLGAPETRVAHRAADLPKAAQRLRYPLLVKANIGGAGAGIVRYDTPAELESAARDGLTPTSVDSVLLLQEYAPARGGRITRIETLAGRFLYALEVETAGDSFDLCPADACLVQPGREAVAMTAVTPSPEVIAAAERIAQAAQLDVGGVECLVDDRDGQVRFYDVNALSNFVARPVEVLGWDPHDRLVDWLASQVGRRAAA
jgi:glutathione synthase/RimK-type ligase-like ATP-grasp enzyme